MKALTFISCCGPCYTDGVWPLGTFWCLYLVDLSMHENTENTFYVGRDMKTSVGVVVTLVWAPCFSLRWIAPRSPPDEYLLVYTFWNCNRNYIRERGQGKGKGKGKGEGKRKREWERDRERGIPVLCLQKRSPENKKYRAECPPFF